MRRQCNRARAGLEQGDRLLTEKSLAQESAAPEPRWSGLGRWRQLEPDLSPVRRPGSRQLSDGFDQIQNHGIVRVQMIFQFVNLSGETSIHGQQLTQSYERAYYTHTHLNCSLRAKHCCGHNCAMLRERIGQISAPATAFVGGRNLRPQIIVSAVEDNRPLMA